MLTGAIKTLNEERGFGFVAGDDGQSYYFRLEALDGEMLAKGDLVTFEPEDHRRGPRATLIRPADVQP